MKDWTRVAFWLLGAFVVIFGVWTMASLTRIYVALHEARTEIREKDAKLRVAEADLASIRTKTAIIRTLTSDNNSVLVELSTRLGTTCPSIALLQKDLNNARQERPLPVSTLNSIESLQTSLNNLSQSCNSDTGDKTYLSAYLDFIGKYNQAVAFRLADDWKNSLRYAEAAKAIADDKKTNAYIDGQWKARNDETIAYTLYKQKNYQEALDAATAAKLEFGKRGAFVFADITELKIRCGLGQPQTDIETSAKEFRKVLQDAMSTAGPRQSCFAKLDKYFFETDGEMFAVCRGLRPENATDPEATQSCS